MMYDGVMPGLTRHIMLESVPDSVKADFATMDTPDTLMTATKLVGMALIAGGMVVGSGMVYDALKRRWEGDPCRCR